MKARVRETIAQKAAKSEFEKYAEICRDSACTKSYSIDSYGYQGGAVHCG